MSVFSHIFSALTNATDWMSAADISKVVQQFHPDTVRRYLRKDPSFKSAILPGKRAYRGWALSTADTTNWTPVIVKKPTSPSTKPTNSFATYKGLNLMCSPTNKPSLILAVGNLLVDEFVTSGHAFTAHDVTRRLREIELNRAKNATRTSPLPLRTFTGIDKNEAGEVYHHGYKLPRIDHEDVKAIVHDIFTAGGMPNLDRIMNKGHLEYDDKDKIAVRVQTILNSTIM